MNFEFFTVISFAHTKPIGCLIDITSLPTDRLKCPDPEAHEISFLCTIQNKQKLKTLSNNNNSNKVNKIEAKLA